ncbi:MAG: AraC family transcriptional regulator [Planctomycetota bacterium]
MDWRYCEHGPPSDLAPFVSCFWELRAAHASPSRRLERVVPDGCAELVFHLGTPFRVVSDAGLHRQAAALLAGVTTSAVLLEPSTDADVFGIRLRPGGMAALAVGAADGWTDVIAPLEQVSAAWPGPWSTDRLQQRLAETRPGAARRSLAGQFLREALRPRPSPVGRAVALLESGRVTVDDVARDCGMSPRQLQRRFRAEVGIGPKHLARLFRLQRAVRLLEESRMSIAHVSACAGFADQAHFGREFRALCRISPSAYRAEHAPLTAAFAGSLVEEPGKPLVP